MPLSGPSGEQGQKLAELIKWGLEDHLSGFISITTYDVATEDFTMQAIDKMRLNGTQIILGPLYSQNVKLLEEFIKENNILMITLSNNIALTDNQNIYIFGHVPLKQTMYLNSYLISSGHKDFAILLPRTRTSQNLNKALSEFIISSGGNVISSNYYDSSRSSIEDVIKNLDEQIELESEKSDFSSKPVILISEDRADVLKEILGNIKEHGLDKKAIIAGDSRLDIEFAGNIDLVFTGSSKLFLAPLREKSEALLGIKRFNYLENLAYDLGAMVSTSVGVSYDRENFLNRLKAANYWSGYSGDIRFNGSVAERKYHIIKREGSQYNIINNN